MFDWVSSWAGELAVVVIIASIIEMITPDGKNKKYIKSILGLFILFAILSPVIDKSKSFDFDDYINLDKFDTQTEETSSAISQDKTVEQLYINNIKKDVKSKLEKEGYLLNKCEVDIENGEKEYGRINRLELNISKSIKNENEENKNEKSVTKNEINIQDVESVSVQISKNEIVETEEKGNKVSKSEIQDIKAYLADLYKIDESIIIVN